MSKKENKTPYLQGCLALIGVGLVIVIIGGIIDEILDGIGRILAAVPWFVWLIIVGLVIYIMNKLNK